MIRKLRLEPDGPIAGELASTKPEHIAPGDATPARSGASHAAGGGSSSDNDPMGDLFDESPPSAGDDQSPGEAPIAAKRTGRGGKGRGRGKKRVVAQPAAGDSQEGDRAEPVEPAEPAPKRKRKKAVAKGEAANIGELFSA